jgi:hypothetical protein
MPATCSKSHKSTSREQVAPRRKWPFMNIKEADARFANFPRGS